MRPDFLMLIYPVITFTESTLHQGSRQTAAGSDAVAATISNASRRSWLLLATHRLRSSIHAADDSDGAGRQQHSVLRSLAGAEDSAQLMIYPAGGHGYGLNNATTGDRWIERCRQWLQSQGWIS